MIRLIFLLLLLVGIEAQAQDGNFIETNGVKIYYEIHGEGEPLLLLHGFTMSGKSWEPWIEDLSRNHKLIIPDLRGHGNSTNPSRAFTHKMSADDMYGLMDHLQIDKFQAMGQCSGAMTLVH
jgi:pimeloyl-ACP methyl ester carboxylesterase